MKVSSKSIQFQGVPKATELPNSWAWWTSLGDWMFTIFLGPPCKHSLLFHLSCSVLFLGELLSKMGDFHFRENCCTTHWSLIVWCPFSLHIYFVRFALFEWRRDLLCRSKAWTQNIDQAGFKLATLLPKPLECWNCRCVLSCLNSDCYSQLLMSGSQ